MQKLTRMLREHKPLILIWFEAREQVSLGAVDRLNSRLKANLRKSYGFRTYRAIKVMLYHKLGALPEPEQAHGFCRGPEKRVHSQIDHLTPSELKERIKLDPSSACRFVPQL